jgi:hypothetical protein
LIRQKIHSIVEKEKAEEERLKSQAPNPFIPEQSLEKLSPHSPFNGTPSSNSPFLALDSTALNSKEYHTSQKLDSTKNELLIPIKEVPEVNETLVLSQASDLETYDILNCMQEQEDYDGEEEEEEISVEQTQKERFDIL